MVTLPMSRFRKRRSNTLIRTNALLRSSSTTSVAAGHATSRSTLTCTVSSCLRFADHLPVLSHTPTKQYTTDPEPGTAFWRVFGEGEERGEERGKWRVLRYRGEVPTSEDQQCPGTCVLPSPHTCPRPSEGKKPLVWGKKLISIELCLRIVSLVRSHLPHFLLGGALLLRLSTSQYGSVTQ